MKHTIALAMLLITISSYAQSPQKMSYQAVVRDTDNQLIINQTINVRISILEGSITGNAVYAEVHTLTTNASGLISLEIGEGDTSDDFEAIEWSEGNHYLKTEFDPTGTENFVISSTSQLLTVPYSFYATEAGFYDEKDPVFENSVANGITEKDTTSWSGKLDIESDPVFEASISHGITELDTANWNSKVGIESDPYFNASVAKGITEADTTSWNNKVESEVDPLFKASVAKGITEADTTSWNNKVESEVDPVFEASVAKGITETDTTSWNNKVDAEIDPVFEASVAKGITEADTTSWNNKLDTEVDPVFEASVAKGITEADTTSWNNKLDTEVDPVFEASVAKGIIEADTTSWNNKLDSEVDPVFDASVAKGITEADTSSWNSKLDGSAQKVIDSLLSKIQKLELEVFKEVMITENSGKIIDERDDSEYDFVVLGNQTWLTSNLNVGTMISAATTSTNNGTIEKYCYNNDQANCEKYGGLYQWDEMMNYQTTEGSQGICPSGWHIPSKNEWIELLTNYSGTQLEEGGSSGFNDVAGGLLDFPSNFRGETSNGIFWSSSLIHFDTNIYPEPYSWYVVNWDYEADSPRRYGHYVRCIKD